MKIDFDQIEIAFGFVSSNQPFMNTALLSKKTGKIYLISEYADSDELPDDIETSDEYIEIPHKNDLGLGKSLVRNFVSEFIPDHWDQIESIFSRKGAYGRFKDYLARINRLEAWYRYEEEQSIAALKEWCELNEIELTQ